MRECWQIAENTTLLICRPVLMDSPHCSRILCLNLRDLDPICLVLQLEQLNIYTLIEHKSEAKYFSLKSSTSVIIHEDYFQFNLGE